MTSNVGERSLADPVYPKTEVSAQATEGSKILTASVMQKAKTQVKEVAGENLTLKIEVEELKNTNSELEKKIKEQAALILKLKAEKTTTLDAAEKAAEEFMSGLIKDSKKNTIKLNLKLATKNCEVLLRKKTDTEKGGFLSELADDVAKLLKSIQSELKVLNDLYMKGVLDDARKTTAKNKFNEEFSPIFDKLRYTCVPSERSTTALNLLKIIANLNDYIIKGNVIKTDIDNLKSISCKTEILQDNIEEKIAAYDKDYDHAKKVQHEIIIKFNAVLEDIKSISLALRDYVILIDPKNKFIAPEAIYKGLINCVTPESLQMTTKRKDFFAIPGGHDFFVDEKMTVMPLWVEKEETASFKFNYIDPSSVSLVTTS